MKKRKITANKRYYFATWEDYDDFARVAEAQGIIWNSGNLPTKYTPFGLSLMLCEITIRKQDRHVVMVYGDKKFGARRWRAEKSREEKRELRDRRLTVGVIGLLIAVILLCTLAVRGVVPLPWSLYLLLPLIGAAILAMYFICKEGGKNGKDRNG